MHLVRLHGVAAAVAATGAVMLGWGIGGVAAMDADLATAAATAPVDRCRDV